MPNQSQKPVDIGGQAVLEGVMMKGPEANPLRPSPNDQIRRFPYDHW